MKNISLLLVSGFFLLLTICNQKSQAVDIPVLVGAEQTTEYLPLLQDKKVAVVANHTSIINGTHLVDSLLSDGVEIEKIFSPEHGFRGDVDAGELFENYTDSLTGLLVISLYGKNFKPKSEDMKDLDIVVFDIQDVGVRFYTYISTLHYMMEACAENDVQLIVLDRPNPNGFYIDGPVLEMKHASFVGLHPIPLVYGLTIGELALMINGEKWLNDSMICQLEVIPCKNYDHSTRYKLPVNPSPNLQNMEAVYLYPSLGLFEGTIVSVGRGTDFPFRVIGMPEYPNKSFSFKPVSIPGVSKYPMYQDSTCYGVDLRIIPITELEEYKKVDLDWIIHMYRSCAKKDKFFNSYFSMLAGTEELREKIQDGQDYGSIKENWIDDIANYKRIRVNYLLYPDFENPNIED